MKTGNRITAILACLREGVAGIYTQKKLDELDKEIETQNWDDFIKEIKMTFSNKTKAADAEWRIEFFKQGKQNTADFMIEFDTLAMKTDIDELVIYKSTHPEIHPRSEVTSKSYKPAFHGSYLSHNTSHGGAATLWIFRLLWRRYSYST